MIWLCLSGCRKIKSLPSTKRDERQTVPRYHPHSAYCYAALFRIQKTYPIPVTEEVRQRLLEPWDVSAPQLKRELHCTGVCVRFQSCRTLPVSRTLNNYFPLSSLCAIFTPIICLMPALVNAKNVTFLFQLFLMAMAGISCMRRA